MSSGSAGDLHHALAAMIAAALSLPCPTVHAQQRAAIDPHPACPDCRVSLQLLATLHGPEVVGEPLSMVRFRNTHYLASFYPDGDQVYAFDTAGNFVRVFARNGQGPGEVSNATHLATAAGDTLLVFDAGRVLRFDSAGNYIDSKRFPARVEAFAALGQGRFALNARVFEADAVGQPLHISDPEWNIIRSFGTPAGQPVRPDRPYQIQRSVTPDGRGGMWTASRTRYELERWTADGRPIKVWFRAVDWFTPFEERHPLDPEIPPDPWIGGIQALDSSRVLVLIQVPQPGWQKSLGEPRYTSSGRVFYPNVDVAELYDTRIEVIDVTAGVLVTSVLEPAVLDHFLDPQHVVGYRQDEAGTPFVDVYRLSVTTR